MQLRVRVLHTLYGDAPAVFISEVGPVIVVLAAIMVISKSYTTGAEIGQIMTNGGAGNRL